MPVIASLVPDKPLGAFVITAAVGFIVAYLLTPLAARWGMRWGLARKPGGRRKHKGPIPRTGSIPIYIAFMVALGVSQFFIRWPWQEALPTFLDVVRADPKELFRIVGMVLSCSIVFAVGLIDDWKELPPLPQYISQIAAGAVAILFLIIIETVNNPFTGQQTPEFPYLVTITVTLFWLGLMTNTVNWLDGVDGLATGVVAIACLVLFLNSAFRLDPPQHTVALMSLALLGATLGFLPYNFAPARIFLGGGAYFLGFLLGVLSIIGGAKAATILLVMGLPLMDVAWQIVNRVVRGKNPAEGDRGHLHFRLIDIGVPAQRIALIYYGFSLAFGTLSLAIPSRLYKFVALIVLGLLSAAVFAWVAIRSRPPAEESG